MSSSTTTTTPVPPFQQWQQFFPTGAYPSYASEPTSIHDQIYAAVAGTAERTKQQAANDIARDILRAVDQNGANNSHITEMSAAQLATAIERNGANAMSTTERVNSQLAAAVERNGANNQAAIERTSGEARLTTVISDAASRQATNDSVRDVLRTVDRTGSETVNATKDSFAALLGAVERNAGENRIQTLTSSGMLDNSLRDVRHSVLNDMNRVGNDLAATSIQNFNVLSKSVTDGAWESRSAMASGFQNISEEHLKTKFDLVKESNSHYSSLLLEQQKMGQYINSKADSHFAMTQLELQKVKEGLACQAATQYAAAQLDAHKTREAIQKDLADAKYEALKSQQFLAEKIGDCCCTVKEKMDTIDRDRLRDNLNVSRDKNSILESIEFQQLFWGGRFGGYGEYGNGRGGSPHRRR